jgi:hypothetical protein
VSAAPPTRTRDRATWPRSSMRPPFVKPFVALILCLSALALGVAAPPAHAAGVPCWKALINDWYDGRIDETYPTSCYTEAIQHLPQDVDTYSSAKDDIERALLASLRQDRRESPTYDPTQAAGGGTAGSDTGSKGIIYRAIEWLGPSNADAVPLPLLILAGVAFLLLAAAGGSFVNRRFQARRLPPPQA